MIRFLLFLILWLLAVLLLVIASLQLTPIRNYAFSKLQKELFTSYGIEISFEESFYLFPFEWIVKNLQIKNQEGLEARFDQAFFFFSKTSGLEIDLVGGHITSHPNLLTKLHFTKEDLLLRGEYRSLRGEGTLSFSTDQWQTFPLELKMEGKTAVTPFVPWASGTFEGVLDARGSLGNIQLEGEGRLTKGKVDEEHFDLPLEDIEAFFRLENNKVYVTSLEARSGKGNLSSQGVLTLTQDFPYEISLNINNISLLEESFAEGIFSGTLFLKGTKKEATLLGELKADSFVISLEEELPPHIETIELHFINGEKKKAHVNPSSFPISLNVFVFLPPHTQVKDQNLSSNWTGTLNLKGKIETPQVFGDIKLVQGRYQFEGKDFKIEEGVVSFSGSVDKKSTIYLTASHEMENLTAYVIVKGALSSPTLSFRSKPPKPQREILSYLLFNRSVGELSPAEGVELSQSITKLNRQRRDPNALETLRKNLGLDRIEITRQETGDETGGISLQLGKRLSSGLYIFFDKSITADSNRLKVEATLTKHLKLQAEISDGEDGESQVTLKWKKDY